MKKIKKLRILFTLTCSVCLLLTGCKVESGHLPTQQHPNPELNIDEQGTSTDSDTTSTDNASANDATTDDSTSNDSNTDDSANNDGDVSKIDPNASSDDKLFVPDTSLASLTKEIQFDSRFIMANTDWNKPAFVWSGVTYTLPFSYARISENWSFKYSDYGLEDNYKLDPHTKTSMDFALVNDTYDFSLLVGFSNPYDVAITLDQADIWALSMDITNATVESTISLPQNITWNSSLVDIITPYNMPSQDIDYDKESNNFTLTYNMNYQTYLELIVNQAHGLVKFTYINYDLNESPDTTIDSTTGSNSDPDNMALAVTNDANSADLDTDNGN